LVEAILVTWGENNERETTSNTSMMRHCIANGPVLQGTTVHMTFD